MLRPLDPLDELLLRVPFQNRHRLLHDNRTCVDLFGNEVDGAAAQSDAGLEGLFLGSHALEGGKEGGVDVQQAATPGVDERGGEDAHETREADDVDGGGTEGAVESRVKVRAGGIVFVADYLEFFGVGLFREVPKYAHHACALTVVYQAHALSSTGCKVSRMFKVSSVTVISPILSPTSFILFYTLNDK